ncbi:hypothetical protein OG539_28080 [Actinacidiphila glaucinigra]|uniref:hypothetical protein n=1 Tax=Actinacidiphila glaucinigra TaxID=235986 RepID=UPI002DDBD046|nr:hypothetical protein [Actinacidiphila glaucinigra]WSD60105.1 hypothetical protein OIE69_14820 [Actinacidiphila glaucinigra]
MRSLPKPESILRDTDWASLEHLWGPAGDVPASLAALRGTDPVVHARVMDKDFDCLRHSNGVSPATVPAALFIAAILPDPSTEVEGTYYSWDDPVGGERRSLLRVELLEWLASLVYDTDDELHAKLLKRGEVSPEIEAVRTLRPLFFQAVAPFLDDATPAVRHAALMTAIFLSEHSDLTGHRPALAIRARDLLATCEHPRYYRLSAISALRAWGEPYEDLMRPTDVLPPRPTEQDGSPWDEAISIDDQQPGL